MPLYFCTPRGDVHDAPPLGQCLRYFEEVRDPETDRVLEYAYQSKAWGSLPMRHAPNIQIARVDFYADQVLKDLLADIKRMFVYAKSDIAALKYRAERDALRMRYLGKCSAVRDSEPDPYESDEEEEAKQQ